MRAKHPAILEMRSETGEGTGGRVCGTERVAGLAEKRTCFGVRADAVRLAGRLVADCMDQGARL